MTKVKICGITNLEDAELSVKFGADALGFNFYQKSPRYITPENAKEIIEKLPADVLKVGVFVNESLEKIVKIAETAKLTSIQLHGEETPEFAKELKAKTNLEIIKAFRVSPEFKPEDVLKYEVDAILLDAYNPKEHGGTGETFDWEIAKKVQEIFPKMYLAGGLSPSNIIEAISEVKPFAVDACSSLEIVKGRKDRTKTREFNLKAKSVKTKATLSISKYVEDSEQLDQEFKQLQTKILGVFEFEKFEKSLFLQQQFFSDLEGKFEISCSYDGVNDGLSFLVLYEDEQVFQAASSWHRAVMLFSLYIQNEGLINFFFEK